MCKRSHIPLASVEHRLDCDKGFDDVGEVDVVGSFGHTDHTENKRFTLNKQKVNFEQKGFNTKMKLKLKILHMTNSEPLAEEFDYLQLNRTVAKTNISGFQWSFYLKRFLVCVDEHVRFQMTLRDRRVRTEITFETLLALVRFLVNLKTAKQNDVATTLYYICT